MKSCGPNRCAAYSRAVRALVGTARKLSLGKKRGGPLGRWVSIRRLALILCAFLCFAVPARGFVTPAPSADPQTPTAQASPQQAGPQTSPSESKTPEQAKTEQYTLSH